MLSGQEEVPPTNSEATLMAEFTLMGDSVEYCECFWHSGSNGRTFHSGRQGENGPVAVTLFKNNSPTNEVSEAGSITLDKLEGPMGGKQLTDLATP
jgi:hypothetical protein